MDHFSFFNCSSLFCSLLIVFHCTFSISYKILQYYIQYCILIRLSSTVGASFFRSCFTPFHTQASIFTFFVCCFILFHSFYCHAQVFGKTLLHEFHTSCSHTECFLLTVQLQVHNVYSEPKSRNS